MRIPGSVITLREAKSPQDITNVARLHQQVFSNLLAGSVGLKFLELYFSRISSSPKGIVYLCEEGDRLVGFVAGLSSKRGFQTLKFNFLALCTLLSRMLIYPMIMLKILRHLRRIIDFRKATCDAELLSIAVNREYRRMGIGKQLLLKFDEFMRKEKVEIYEIFTDLKDSAGYSFYESLGCTLHLEIDSLGSKARVYFRALI